MQVHNRRNAGGVRPTEQFSDGKRPNVDLRQTRQIEPPELEGELVWGPDHSPPTNDDMSVRALGTSIS
jgi:hypothetical protein